MKAAMDFKYTFTCPICGKVITIYSDLYHQTDDYYVECCGKLQYINTVSANVEIEKIPHEYLEYEHHECKEND